MLLILAHEDAREEEGESILMMQQMTVVGKWMRNANEIAAYLSTCIILDTVRTRSVEVETRCWGRVSRICSVPSRLLAA